MWILILIAPSAPSGLAQVVSESLLLQLLFECSRFSLDLPFDLAAVYNTDHKLVDLVGQSNSFRNANAGWLAAVSITAPSPVLLGKATVDNFSGMQTLEWDEI